MVAVVLGTALSALGPASGQQTKAVDDLSRYCTVCWRHARLHPDCWMDCTQEVLTRLLERVSPKAWDRVLAGEGEERREFLRAIDAVKKRTQRRRSTASVSGEEVADPRFDSERERADDREELARAAGKLLTDRQRRILYCSLAGWPVHEIARALNVSVERISDDKYKAVRKLRSYFQSRA